MLNIVTHYVCKGAKDAARVLRLEKVTSHHSRVPLITDSTKGFVNVMNWVNIWSMGVVDFINYFRENIE